MEEDWQGQVSDRVMEERRHRIQARPAGPEIEDGLSPLDLRVLGLLSQRDIEQNEICEAQFAIQWYCVWVCYIV